MLSDTFRTERDVVQHAAMYREAGVCHFSRQTSEFCTETGWSKKCVLKNTVYRFNLVSDGGTLRFVITLSSRHTSEFCTETDWNKKRVLKNTVYRFHLVSHGGTIRFVIAVTEIKLENLWIFEFLIMPIMTFYDLWDGKVW